MRNHTFDGLGNLLSVGTRVFIFKIVVNSSRRDKSTLELNYHVNKFPIDPNHVY